MMRVWSLGVCAALLAVPVHAESWPANYPLPQDAMLVPLLANIQAVQDDVQRARVYIDLGLKAENPFWDLSQVQLKIFLEKLGTLPDKPLPEDDIWPQLPRKDANYRGVTILLETVEGKRFAPLRVFEGKVMAADPRYEGTTTSMIGPDFGRHLEYWLFGTAHVRRDQLIGVNVMPVLTFEQCRLMGQRIVETTPRQCLLPDNNLLLESSDVLTLRAAKVSSFDQCLKNGKELIYTFPRRCVAAGGRVFTEPPRVIEAPAIPPDAPLAARVGEISTSAAGLKAVSTTEAVRAAQSVLGSAAIAAVSVSAPPAISRTLVVTATLPVSATPVVTPTLVKP